MDPQPPAQQDFIAGVLQLAEGNGVLVPNQGRNGNTCKKAQKNVIVSMCTMYFRELKHTALLWSRPLYPFLPLCLFILLQAALDKWEAAFYIINGKNMQLNMWENSETGNVEKTCYQITFFTQSYFMLLQNKIYSNFTLKARIMLLKQQQCDIAASL